MKPSTLELTSKGFLLMPDAFPESSSEILRTARESFVHPSALRYLGKIIGSMQGLDCLSADCRFRVSPGG